MGSSTGLNIRPIVFQLVPKLSELKGPSFGIVILSSSVERHGELTILTPHACYLFFCVRVRVTWAFILIWIKRVHVIDYVYVDFRDDILNGVAV